MHRWVDLGSVRDITDVCFVLSTDVDPTVLDVGSNPPLPALSPVARVRTIGQVSLDSSSSANLELS